MTSDDEWRPAPGPEHDPGSDGRRDDTDHEHNQRVGGRLRGLLDQPIRVVLAAVVIGALVAGAAVWAIGGFDDAGSVGGTGIGESERLVQNAFTQSVAGDCLDWPAGRPGSPEKITCEDKHRFEVAGKLDTKLLPGSEFGEAAPYPGPVRFESIRNEQCPVIVDDYLAGKLDPQGRFSVGIMYPPKDQWDKGARELRCGIQQTGPDRFPEQFAGRVADQDQSFQWVPGTCVGIDENRKPTYPVNCTEKHAFQTTGIVDLAPRFGDRVSGKPWPGAAAQNTFLQSVCPVQTERFLGGKDKLEKTTLNVQWSVISEVSWLAGSRKVVCYVGLPDRGGFATLVGDARSTLLINGKVPVPPPAAPPGRALPTAVPMPPGIAPNPAEEPAPAG
ncbi:septum formation family protein [Gordonia soli]|nr:septum formation family protein [Gordonia soli]